MKNKLKFLNDHIMQFIYEDVSTCIKEGKEEDAAKMVENIVQQGAYDPKEIYRPLLCWAAFRGDTKTAEFCKNQEADLDFEDHLGRTPLWVAKSSGQRQMVEALESWGARNDVHRIYGKASTSSKRTTPSSSEGSVASRQKLEMKHSYVLGFYNSELSEYIKQGIEKEYIKKFAVRCVERFLQSVECGSKELYGWLLLCAANKGDVETARFCKDQGADPNFKDKNGSTPLWQARVGGNDQMVEALKEWGAHGETDEWWGKSDNKPSCCTGFYTSVLCQGYKNGLSEKNLVSAVEDFARNKGYEPKQAYEEFLCCAAIHDNVEIAKLCKSQGADPNCKDASGKTPLDLAKKHKSHGMAKILEEWSAQKDTHKFSKKQPSSSLESPGCSGQAKYGGHAKKACTLI
ncbi:MAG: ankyrin repeat domain-containing protein [Wolbachia endosymbiont of Ephestia elutella]|uniref:Ankyrin repeat domain-containing protein n=1 Tax=Wolbachia endosymbiont of Ephestia elutella TaxID=3231696 RepID=A0AAU8MM78_9RICK